MNTFIYIRQGLQRLPQMINISVNAPLSWRKMKGISSQVCKLSRWYSFQASLFVGYATC
jgi:hypothetical protein